MSYMGDNSGNSGAGGGSGSYLGDAQPAYTTWANAIKSLGGVVTTWPFSSDANGADPNYGKPAAKFDVATYVALFNGGKISAQDVQRATAGNAYAYVLAPDDVARAAKDLTKVTGREAAGLPGGISGWNPFANTSMLTKVVVGSALVTGVAALTGLFRGRR